MAQMKEQSKTPEKELKKMEKSKLLDAEFKILVIRMLSDLSKSFNSIKEVMESIEKKQSERYTKIKNNL